MTIHATCPSCSKSLNTPDSAAGKTLKCPECGEPILVDAGDIFSGPFADPPVIELPPIDLNTATPKPPARKKCPFCAELIAAEAIKCRHCGSMLGPTTVDRAVEGLKKTTDRGVRILMQIGYCGAALVVAGLLYSLTPAQREASKARDHANVYMSNSQFEWDYEGFEEPRIFDVKGTTGYACSFTARMFYYPRWEHPGLMRTYYFCRFETDAEYRHVDPDYPPGLPAHLSDPPPQRYLILLNAAFPETIRPKEEDDVPGVKLMKGLLE